MYVKCKKCNQKYYVPAEQIRNKKSYFQCDVCGSQVIVDNRNLLESHDQILTDNRITAKDILEGVYFSFNQRNIFISFFTLFFLMTISIIFWEIYSNNVCLFFKYRVLSLIGILFFILFIIFLFNLHLYLISKNTFSNIKAERNFVFAHIKSILARDISPIFWISAGIILIMIMIILPMRISDTYSIVHTGLFFPVLVILSLMLMVILGCNNLVYAYIASKSSTAMATIKNFFKFLKVENINIPIYLFLIYMVSIMIFFVFSFIVGMVVFALIYAIKKFLCINLVLIFCDIKAMILSGKFFKIFSLFNCLSLELRIGLGLFLFSILIIMLYLFAYYVSLVQSLSTVSIHIMRSNPARSVSRVAILAALFFIFIFALILNFLPSIISFISNFKP